MMGELFSLIGPAPKLIPPKSRILIKPNLTSEESLWEKGILTGPVFMQALVEEVQKAFALPPGLAVFTASDKALARAATIDGRGYYFDFLEFAVVEVQKPGAGGPGHFLISVG